MRIGVLTFHRSINYGAFMQCFALTKEIERRFGSIVEVIDFELLSKSIMYSPGVKSFLKNGFAYSHLYKRFRDDLSLLPLSPDTLVTNDYKRVYDYINERYDLVIVGSDAVWAYNHHLGLRNPYWLGPEIKCMKMSYAASAYSLDVNRMTNEERDYIAKCLNDYEYIGVRDDETLNLCKSISPSLQVFRNCDPTVLLPAPDISMAKSILSRMGVDVSKKIVSFMISGNPFVDYFKELLGNEYEYVYLLSRNSPIDRFIKPRDHYLFDLSPYEWYTVFSAFYLNITKYFHGTLLALKSCIPTISFDVTNMGEHYISKIRQILRDLDLSCFWINNTNSTKEEVKDRLQFILEHHDSLRTQIQAEMEKEKKQSESFFNKLNEIINHERK